MVPIFGTLCIHAVTAAYFVKVMRQRLRDSLLNEPRREQSDVFRSCRMEAGFVCSRSRTVTCSGVQKNSAPAATCYKV